MSPASCVQVQSISIQPGFPLLVVSSDEQDHSSLHRILREDCRLHGASGRREAMSSVRRFHPRVVVCDQTFADGDWRELLSDLQAEQQMPPLIVSSRLADDRLWAEVLNLGGYDLLTKPFVAAEVSRVVKLAAHRASKTVQY
jgi:DNA-binding response OmpR family regulator